LKNIRINKPSNIEKEYGLSTDSVVKIVEESLVKKSKFFIEGQYAYRSLGGSNNYGFVVFTSKNKNSDWITKIATEKLLIREALFFDYHKNDLEKESGFAANTMGYDSLKNTDLEFLTLEKLEEAKRITSDQIYNLYSKSKSGQALFDNGLLVAAPKLEPGTRIKDVLVFLVCDFESENAKDYIDNFFIERIEKLPKYCNQLLHIQFIIQECYEVLKNVDNSLIGFVHGDFKNSNIMMDSKKQLKLIDFQYYCRGIRVWDLAFYFSKSKQSFSKGLGPILDKISTENEKKYLVFFYIFAVLLHPKPSIFEKEKCKPALEYLVFLMKNIKSKSNIDS
jgi:serine/threonine protein kinase